MQVCNPICALCDVVTEAGDWLQSTPEALSQQILRLIN